MLLQSDLAMDCCCWKPCRGDRKMVIKGCEHHALTGTSGVPSHVTSVCIVRETMSLNVERLRRAFQPRSSPTPWCNGPAWLLNLPVALRKSERLKKNNQTLQVLFGQWVGEHVLMLREEVSQGVGLAIVQQVHPMGNTQQGRGVEVSVPLLVFNPCVISCRVRVIRGDMAIGTPGLFEDFFSRLEKHLGGRDLFWWRCCKVFMCWEGLPLSLPMGLLSWWSGSIDGFHRSTAGVTQ